MRTIFVVIIVIVCLAPIFTGIGYGIGNLLEKPPNCSIKKCGNNEQLKQFDDHSVSCICLPYFHRNDTTQKCVLKPQWVSDYTPESIYDPKFVHQYNAVQFIVARLVYENGDKVPYEAVMEFGNIEIQPFPEINRSRYERLEVLLVAPGEHEWVKSSNGIILDNAIEGGQISDEIVYVCRVGVNAGVMQPSQQTCITEFSDGPVSSYYLLVLKN